MNPKDEARFLAKVNRQDGCWIWRGAKNDRGYGQFWLNARLHYAHRVAYEHFKEPIPEGLAACHHCDNPICVNPDHLFLGTHKDNMRDMRRKGRSTSGERNNHAKLTWEDVRTIRRRRAAGERGIDLAHEYQMHPNHISEIVSGVIWKEVEAANCEVSAQ